MQTITVSGNIGKPPELRSTQSGEQVLAFSVAVKQGWGDKESTNWYRCNVWGKRAATLERFLRKGMKVVIQGELTIGSYEGKAQYDIRANEVEFMSAAEGGEQNNTRQSDNGSDNRGGGGGGFSSGGFGDDDLDSDSVPF